MFKSIIFQLLIIFIIVFDVSDAAEDGLCDDYEWSCDSGECIARENLCDGQYNCADQSDETFANCLYMNCPDYAFRCAYGACIKGSDKCNGQRNCVDNSDETQFLCAENGQTIFTQSKERCNSNYMIPCFSGECVGIEYLCDGEFDCADKSDETVEMCSHINCPPYAFRCAYGSCIAGNKKCDGKSDCADGSDESDKLCGVTPSTAYSPQIPYRPVDSHGPKRPVNPPAVAYRPVTPAYSQPTGPLPRLPSETTTSPTPFGCLIPLQSKHLIVKSESTNAIVSAGEYVASGTSVMFSCEPQWKMLGLMTNKCTDNRWDYQLPSCNKQCSSISLNVGISTIATCYYKAHSVNCKGLLNIGTLAHIQCAPGYTLQPKKVSQQLVTIINCNMDAEWDHPKFKCIATCGIAKLELEPNEAKPWEVSIFRRSSVPNFTRVCAGSIISPKLVITAAGCFSTNIHGSFGNDPVYYNIVKGYYHKNYTQGDGVGAQMYNISQIVFSEYREANHIALLVLVQYFTFSNSLMPVCITRQRNTTVVAMPVGTVEMSPISMDMGSGITFIRAQDERYILTDVVDRSIDEKYSRVSHINFFFDFIENHRKRYNHIL